MRIMGKRAGMLFIFCLLFMGGIAVFLFSYAKDAGTWATYPVNRHLYTEGRLKESGSVLDRDGVVLSVTNDGATTFNADAGVRKAVLHITGDGYGNIATSIPVTKRKEITGWNPVTGAYSFDAGGNDITTTVDAGLCRTASRALGDNRGAVGVVNYRTGEILCMVSHTGFDPANRPDISGNPEKYDGVYINRFLSSSYTPGSIFKLVTCAAALDNLEGAAERTFQCDGRHEFGGGAVTCPKVHGSQSFAAALANSCNVAYAQMAVELGGETLAKYAGKAGFGGGMSVDGIKCNSGSFSAEGANESQTGWAGVGQHTTLANPLTFLMYVASIANGGEAVNPHIIKGTHLLNGAGRTLSEATAEEMKELMRYTVTSAFGEKGLAGYELCAKSGTAEVGEGKTPHAWFTGFLGNEDTPYAFIVIVENGGAGSGIAADIASAVMKDAVKLES